MPAPDTPESRVYDEKQPIAISELFVDSKFRRCVRCVSRRGLGPHFTVSIPFALKVAAAAGLFMNMIKAAAAGEPAAFGDGAAEKPM